MELRGRRRLPASPQTVFTAVSDLTAMAALIPACERIEQLTETTFTAKLLLRIDGFETCVEGRVEVTRCAPADGADCAFRLTGQAHQKGAAAVARGAMDVVLTADGVDTVLSYEATVTVAGFLAAMDETLVESAATSFLDEVFARLAQSMPSRRIEPTRAQTEEGLAPQVWVAGLIGTVIILLVVFSLVL